MKHIEKNKEYLHTPYRIIEVKENNSFYLKNTVINKVLYTIIISINSNCNKIMIIEHSTGSFLHINLESREINEHFINYISKEIYNGITSNLNISNNIDFDVDRFLDIFILAIKYNQRINGTITRLQIFKYETIKKIKPQGFLCNCVTGFYPERKFFLNNVGRIYEKDNMSHLSYEQEEKIWTFLLQNLDRVGVYHNLTIYDYCLNRYVPIIINSFETKGLIKFIDKTPENKFTICISYQNKLLKSNRSFYEQELIDMVKSFR